jgi:hypothetical protein
MRLAEERSATVRAYYESFRPHLRAESERRILDIWRVAAMLVQRHGAADTALVAA